jgi:hypothetical protein
LFLGPAKCIFLDAPTASLEPTYEVIVDFRQERMFMLCSPVLSKAESLCGPISVMIKACVYTVGSPGYLSSKFGTEYRVGVMLSDETPATSARCDAFFGRNLPSAKPFTARPKTRIYNVPASDFKLSQLQNNGAGKGRYRGSIILRACRPRSSAFSWRLSGCPRAVTPSSKASGRGTSNIDSILIRPDKATYYVQPFNCSGIETGEVASLSA